MIRFFLFLMMLIFNYSTNLNIDTPIKTELEQPTTVTTKTIEPITIETNTENIEETTKETIKESMVFSIIEPVTEPVTEAVTEAVTNPTQNTSTLFTDVIYKNGKETLTFKTIDEAKKNIPIKLLSDSEINNAIKNNKATYAIYISELINSINEYRKENNLHSVTLDDNLTNAAMHRAIESAYADWNMTAKENGVKRHIRPNFEKASSIFKQYNILGDFAENYGRYADTPTEILIGWQNSPSHNAILLKDIYTKIGVGVAKDKDDNLYWIILLTN